jgi:head-tail adaptor
MNSFSLAELAAMQDTQEEAMQDTCELLIRGSKGQDEYGQPVEEWIFGAETECGLEMVRSSEYRNAEAAVFDARLRLPIDTDVSNIDRVYITHRFGVMLERPLAFDLVGNTRRGPSGLVVDLREAV